MNRAKLIDLLSQLNTKSLKTQTQVIKEIGYVLRLDYGFDEEETDKLVSGFAANSGAASERGQTYAAKRNYAIEKAAKKKAQKVEFYAEGSKYGCYCNACSEQIPAHRELFSEGKTKWCVECGINVNGALAIDNYFFQRWATKTNHRDAKKKSLPPIRPYVQDSEE